MDCLAGWAFMATEQTARTLSSRNFCKIKIQQDVSFSKNLTQHMNSIKLHDKNPNAPYSMHLTQGFPFEIFHYK